MILPHTELSLILLLCLSMLCWGSWPVFYKLAGKYRFEFFYFDFAVGLGLLALVAALTVGSMGFDGFSFTDDLMNARKQAWVFAFLSGLIFNCGNMFMMAAISVAGMAVAVPWASGMALVIGYWVAYLGHPGMNTTMLLGGTVLILLSLTLNGSAYSRLRVLQHETLARAGKAKSTRRPGSAKGIVLALIGGLVMGTFAPLLLKAQDPDMGVGPYALLFLFAAAAGLSTCVYDLFFMNLPVEGQPLEIPEYFKEPIRSHTLGVLSGAIWGIGALASFVVATPKGDTHLSGPLGAILVQAAPIIAALWGLLVWKEFKGGDIRIKAFGPLMLVLFAGAVVVFAYAAVSGKP
jgi:glucose uptake protein